MILKSKKPRPCISGITFSVTGTAVEFSGDLQNVTIAAEVSKKLLDIARAGKPIDKSRRTKRTITPKRSALPTPRNAENLKTSTV